LAVGAWTFYNKFRKNLGIAAINLAGAPNIRLMLFTSASNAATLTISTRGSLTSEVANAVGYATSGQICSTHTYTAGASAGQMRFNINAKQWKASGGNIISIKFAVLVVSGGKLICYSQLSTAQFTLTSGNTLTITPAATGVFNLA
jgi:hypothetical protein